MGLFKKPEMRTLALDYRFELCDDFPAIQGYGDVFGEYRYCNVYLQDKRGAFGGDEERYNRLMDALRAGAGKVKIEFDFRMKDGKAKDFTLDLVRLGQAIGNPDAENLEIIGWGLTASPEL